jgi:hypothetical protein
MPLDGSCFLRALHANNSCVRIGRIVLPLLRARDQQRFWSVEP